MRGPVLLPLSSSWSVPDHGRAGQPGRVAQPPSAVQAPGAAGGSRCRVAACSHADTSLVQRSRPWPGRPETGDTRLERSTVATAWVGAQLDSTPWTAPPYAHAASACPATGSRCTSPRHCRGMKPGATAACPYGRCMQPCSGDSPGPRSLGCRSLSGWLTVRRVLHAAQSESRLSTFFRSNVSWPCRNELLPYRAFDVP